MKLRKAFSLFAAAALCLSLAACGNSSNPGGGGGSGGVKLPKKIEVQVPASAGGGTDVAARALTTYINQNSDSNMTVVNNNDGGGVVAFETVRSAKADGSTILFFHTTMSIKVATGLYDKSPSGDFKVIGCALPEDPGGYVLVVPTDSGISDLDGFISAAKDAGGSMMIGIETGGSSHIMAGIMAGELGIELNYVEAGPDTEKLTALVGGSINCALVNGNQAKQYIEANKVNALACFSSSDEGGRSSILPDVPSFKEQGYNCIFGTYFYVLGSKDMSDDTAKAINDLFTAAASDPDTHEVLASSGFGMTYVPFEDAQSTIAGQESTLKQVCADLGLAG